MVLATALFVLVTISLFAPAQTIRDCYSSLDRGYRCYGHNPVLRYYYDTTLETCLPFLFQGCGGNGNNYESEDACFSRCRKLDYFGCLGGRAPTGYCDHEWLACPEGSICIRDPLLNVGRCCDRKTEEEFKMEKKPQCDGAKILIKKHVKGRWEPLLGRSCSHEFCPDGAECIQGKWFAHCCGPVEKFGPEKV